MKYFINYNVFKLIESTSEYFPGYSDDGTSDNLSVIQKKASKTLNKELDKYFDDYLKVKDKSELLWNKWCFSNMVLTSLNNYFEIKRDIFDKVVEFYKELEKDENIKLMFSDRHKPNSPKLFKDSMILINKKLSELIEYDDKTKTEFEKDNIPVDRKSIYAPYFLNMEEDIKLKDAINQKY